MVSTSQRASFWGDPVWAESLSASGISARLPGGEFLCPPRRMSHSPPTHGLEPLTLTLSHCFMTTPNPAA